MYQLKHRTLKKNGASRLIHSSERLGMLHSTEPLNEQSCRLVYSDPSSGSFACTHASDSREGEQGSSEPANGNP